MVHNTAHDAVRFQLAKLLDQHFLGDRRNGPLQFRKPHQTAPEKMKQDGHFPSPLQQLQGGLHAMCRSDGGIIRSLTFR